MTKTEDPVVVHPELRAWMDDRGIRQFELARMLGVSGAQVSRYLNGKVDMPADMAVRLAMITGIPPENLVNDPETARSLKFLGSRPIRPSRKVR